MGAANDGLRFLLEVTGLVAIFVWGLHTGKGISGWVVGAGLVLLVSFLWATWITPNSEAAVGDPGRLALEIGVFSAATGALIADNRPKVAAVFAAVVAVHLLLTFVLDQR